MRQRILALLFAPIVSMGACHRQSSYSEGAGASTGNESARSSSVPNDSAPVLVALVPDSIRSGSAGSIAILGRHFATDTNPPLNTVLIGRIELRRIAANAAGTELRVMVPATWSATEAPPTPLRPGSYDVAVRSSAGQSNVLRLRVLP